MRRTTKKHKGDAPGSGLPEGRRRGINSVEIGLTVLNSVIALREPATLKSIAEHSGLDSSQAHRYVSSLANFGLLRQEYASGRYDLGPAALQIGLAALARTDGIALVDREALEFSRRNDYTVLVAVWGSYGPTVIRWHHGRPPVYTTLAIGSVLPLVQSATGRVFLAYLPDALLETALAREGYSGAPGRRSELTAIREDVRSRRMASVDGSAVPGLRAFSVPVLGVDSHLIAAVTAAASTVTPTSKDRKVKSRLLDLSLRVSAQLGAMPESTGR